jgi:SAM-dependent methyltransferase
VVAAGPGIGSRLRLAVSQPTPEFAAITSTVERARSKPPRWRAAARPNGTLAIVTDLSREEDCRTLTADEAKRFYDRFGGKQDLQAFYEDPALDDLIAHSDFEHATAVFEFACGTGRLAERLMSAHLPSGSSYLGVDVSVVMVGLARARLLPWGARAEVTLSTGSMHLDAASGGFDRFLATYVLDLLSVEDSQRLLRRGPPCACAGGAPVPREPHRGRDPRWAAPVMGLAASPLAEPPSPRRVPADPSGPHRVGEQVDASLPEGGHVVGNLLGDSRGAPMRRFQLGQHAVSGFTNSRRLVALALGSVILRDARSGPDASGGGGVVASAQS